MHKKAARPVWFQLDPATFDLPPVLSETIGLDALTAGALTVAETRPRCTRHRDGALVILRGINTEPGSDPEDMVSLRMWVEGARIVTCQYRRLDAEDDLARELAAGDGPAIPRDFVVTLADRQTDRMQDVVDDIDTGLEGLGEAQADQPVPDLRRSLSALRRKLVILRRYMAPRRDALDELVAEAFTWQTEL